MTREQTEVSGQAALEVMSWARSQRPNPGVGHPPIRDPQSDASSTSTEKGSRVKCDLLLTTHTLGATVSSVAEKLRS